MGEILGVGCTHRPLMLRPNEDWTFIMRAALDDPAMPEEMKNPASWPAPLREELGNDWGASAAVRGREVYRAHFAEARRVIDEFNPDVVIMWGDDQPQCGRGNYLSSGFRFSRKAATPSAKCGPVRTRSPSSCSSASRLFA